MSARAALGLLQSGGLTMGPDWQRAHEICQTREGTRDYDLVHALCHWIEGDIANREYWLRRAAPWQPAETLEAEWQAVSLALS
jgi:hypothetical protein